MNITSPEAQKQAFKKPLHTFVLEPSQLISQPTNILKLVLRSTQLKELEVAHSPAEIHNIKEIESSFSFQMNKDGMLHGFGSWFDVEFEPMTEQSSQVTLSTSPNDR